jgi:hypothetical protein
MACQVATSAESSISTDLSQYSIVTPSMPSTTFPPFPDNVPTHPLLIIDYELIKARDKEEIDRLWKAGTGLGFW